MTDIAAVEATEQDEFERAEALIEGYQELRKRVYEAARRNDGALMGSDSWLRFAMDENSLELSAGPNGIDVWGNCYSMQTMSNEHFSFFINFSDL